MNKENSHYYLIILIIFVFVSRLAFYLDHNVFLSDDDAGFALAAHDYNIFESRPHLPGYIVLVKSIEALNTVTHDSFNSMKILVILFTILSAIVIFKLFEFHFNGKNSFLLSLLLFSNPLIWFYQCTPESYIYDLFFASLIALIFLKRKSYYYFLPLISVMGGIRMSSSFFFIPLYFYVTYTYYKENRINGKSLVFANLLGIVLTAFWVIPLLQSVGGFSEYLKLYKTHSPMPALGLIKNMAGFVSYAITIFIPFYPIIIALLIKRKIKWITFDKTLLFHLYWIVPSMLFFMFGHYSKGYVYLIYPAIIILYGLFYLKNFKSLKLLYLTIALQIIFFIFYPYTKVLPNTFFRREIRHSSLTTVFWNRLNNGYLHTLSRLENRDELNKSFDDCVHYLQKNTTNFILFDGKSSLMTINSEAYRFPNLTFATQKNFYIDDQYIVQKKFDLKYEYGLVELYKKVYILCDIELIPYYIDMVDVVYKNKLHALIKVKAGKEKEFKEFYQNLYAKN